jgi:predicted transcriptional regulator
MTQRDNVLAALATGPKTNRDLQEVLGVHSAYVARLMVRMREDGLVARRVVKARAIYVLPRSGACDRCGAQVGSRAWEQCVRCLGP